MRSRIGLLALCGALALAAAARAGETWTKLADAPEDPAGREMRPGQLGAWCHVPELGGFVLYGGRSPCFNNAMWLFTPADGKWRPLACDDSVTRAALPAWQREAAGDAFAGGVKWRARRPEEIAWSPDRPGAGDSYGTCYDPDSGRLRFLGGFRYLAGGELGLWDWNPRTGGFARVASKAPEGAFRLAYDAARKLVVAAPVMGRREDSCGTIDASGAWRKCEGPQAGGYPAMAYDGSAKVTVLFTSGGETWEFDGAAWKAARPAVSPPARAHAGMCYAPAAGGVVLVGGVSGKGGVSWVYHQRGHGKIFQDVWRYDAARDAWEEVPETAMPRESTPNRAYWCDALDYDPGSKSAVLYDPCIGVWALRFGGGGNGGGGAPPAPALPEPRETAPAGEGTGPRKLNPKIEALGENSWANLEIREPGGNEIGLAYDEANRLVFKYGGCGTGPAAPGDYGYSNQACVLDVASGKWHVRRPTHMYGGDRRPINGCGRAYCFDSKARLIWTINGVSSHGTGGPGGLFSYDAAADQFDGPFGGPHATSTAMCHSPDHDMLLLLNRNGQSHVFDLKAKSWKATAKGPDTSGYDQIVYLPGRKLFMMILRTETGEAVEKPDYAGTGPTRACHKDKATGRFRVTSMVSWAFDPAKLQWERLAPKSEPAPPRTYDGFCYDSRNGVAILTGGSNALWTGQKEKECPVSDVWVYEPAANDWKEMKPANPPPAAQKKAACCFDTEHGVVITSIGRGIWAYRYR